MLALKEHQVNWVCRHLGHTKDIHQTYYKQTSGAIERIQLGKLMLIQDRNIVAQFQNKSLDEIQFKGKKKKKVLKLNKIIY